MLIFLLLNAAQGIFFILPPQSEVCIGYIAVAPSDLWGVYVVSGEGDKNVQVQVYNPRNIIVFINDPGTREGKFSLKNAGQGNYRLCFRSLDSTHKSINFEMTSENKTEALSAETIEPLVENLRMLSRKIDDVYRNLFIFQRREKVHRDLTENNCNRILWAAIVKIAGLSAITCLQIWGLTRILNKSSSNKI